MVFRRKLLALAGLIVVPGAVAGGAAAQSLSSVGLSPQTTCSPTVITVTGNLNCANSTVDSTRVTRVGPDIVVDVFVTEFEICLPAIIPFETQAPGPILLTAGLVDLVARTFTNKIVTDSLRVSVEVTGDDCPVPTVPTSWGAIKFRFSRRP